MKKIFIIAAAFVPVIFALCLVQTTAVYAQKPDNEKDVKKPKTKNYEQAASVAVSGVREQTNSKSGSSDLNIKEGFSENDPDTPMTVPSTKSSDGNCKIMLDNWTNYSVQVYINGAYRGVLSGGDESTLYYAPGDITIYIKAPFTGDYIHCWSPKKYSCGANQYIYYKIEY